jgi:predicted dehydrogenase
MQIGIVGFGRIAQKHLDVLNALNISVVASVNRSQEKKELAFNAGIPNNYSTIEDMVAHHKLDGIICCVSFQHIFEVASELIKFKIPILLEKPPGLSVHELLTLNQYSKEHKTPVMVGMNRRHYSILNRALEHMGGKDAITSLTLEWSEDPQSLTQRFSSYEINHFIYANTLHGLDLITYCLGPIKNVHIQRDMTVDSYLQTATLTGLSQSNQSLSFISSWESPLPWRLTLNTYEHHYLFAPLENCRYINRQRQWNTLEVSEVDQNYKPGFYAQAEIFIEGCRGYMNNFNQHSLMSCIPPMTLAQSLTQEIFLRAP